MADNRAHYRQLASQALQEADAAILDNVRDRALRSAATFEAMALRHEQMVESRARREASAQENSGLD